ncbi:hypothetical protein FRC20_002785 [Serendipita sp. 405]|nr:hypothetical protein FRC20_002785 [Serendipita sp. 405]
MQLQSIAANLLQRIQAALWLENCPQYSLFLDPQGRPAQPPPTLSTSSTKLVYGLSHHDTTSTASNRLASSTSVLSSISGQRTTKSSRRPLVVIKDDTNPGLLADGHYEIDSRTGFVPCSVPVTSLPAAFGPWESALAVAPLQLALADADDDSPLARTKRLSGQQWRAQFAQMPVLDIAALQHDVHLLRRAHHVLAYLVHFYVHSSPPDPSNPTCILIPKSLAVPLVQVSKLLDIAPVLTFADTVLWNHEIIHNEDEDDTEVCGKDRRYTPLTRENIRPLTLFTRGPDEANFYGCCAEIELRGVEALRAIAYFYDSVMTKTNSTTIVPFASMDDETLEKAAECLNTVAGVIRDLTSILQSVRPICDPHAFYNSVRPWFRGSDPSPPVPRSPSPGRSQGTCESDDDSGSEAGSIHASESLTTKTSASSQVVATSTGQRRWIYEGVDDQEVLELSGPSAGQSSIIHTLDIFLDVDHSSNNSSGSGNNRSDIDTSSTTPSPHSSSPSSSAPTHPSSSLAIVDKAQLTPTTNPTSTKPLSTDSLEASPHHHMTTSAAKRSTTPSLLSGHHPSTKLDDSSRFGNRTPSSTFASSHPYSTVETVPIGGVRSECPIVASSLDEASRDQTHHVRTVDDAGAGMGSVRDASMKDMMGKCPVMKKRMEEDEPKKSPNGEFMTRMRKYMPGSHQAFLEQLTVITHGDSKQQREASSTTVPLSSDSVDESMPEGNQGSTASTCPFARPISIRMLAQAHPDKLLKPYNDAVMALKQFRDAHIRIACLYVVSMSRKGSGVPAHGRNGNGNGTSSTMGGGMSETMDGPQCKVGVGSMGMAMCPVMRSRQQESSQTSTDGRGRRQHQPVRGTGGNELSLLLKSCRDATSRTLLHPTSTA